MSEWLGGPGAALTLEDQARAVGAQVGVELRLFEGVGRWAADEQAPEVALCLDTASAHHAWHAELLRSRLPLAAHLDAQVLTAAPSGPLAGALDALFAESGAASRLGALSRVLLPRLVAGYRLHLARLVPVADAALARVLRLVVRDEVESMLELELMLELLLERTAPPQGPETALWAGLEARFATLGPGLVRLPGG